MYLLPNYALFPNEWYVRNTGSCTFLESLSPITLPNTTRSAPPPWGIVITGHLFLQEGADYEFSLNYTDSIRLYLGDPLSPQLQIFTRIPSPTVKTSSLIVSLPKGYTYFRIIWETSNPTPPLQVRYRQVGESTWRGIYGSLLRRGGTHLTSLSHENVMMVKNSEYEDQQTPGVSGMPCIVFAVTPSLPSGLEMDVLTGMIHGVMKVGNGIVRKGEYCIGIVFEILCSYN